MDNDNVNDEYEKCWLTGEYDVDDCFECPHKYECSGYNEDFD